MHLCLWYYTVELSPADGLDGPFPDANPDPYPAPAPAAAAPYPPSGTAAADEGGAESGAAPGWQ